ncbi:Small subunit (SSU) processome component [Ciborinia camelliae]|nr:Small subunit (SSU) processome component [Ciborinia camelliae]
MSSKRKLPTKLGQPMVKQGVKSFGTGHLDESKTVVSGGGTATKVKTNGANKDDVVEISSDSENGSDDDLDEIEEDGSDMEEDGNATADVTMGDDGAEVAEEDGEPTFGDLVRAHASEPIDVAAAFEDSKAQALSYPQNSIQAPSGASLGTVLTQALKTNDVALLESCLHTTDLSTIRSTIQRLDSPLAAILLQKLAERLHRRPGRAGSLMVWVQWSMITHGGYLATQRGLIKKLAEVNRVLDERSKALQHLLSLKGKLDMLDAQIELRRSMQNRPRIDSEDNDEGVIYVEGQSDDEEEVIVNGLPQRLAKNGDLEDISDSEIEEEMLNGLVAESDEEEEDSEDDLIDDEAEETDADSGDEDEVDHDDIDEQGEDDESDDAVPGPPRSKMQKLSGSTFQTRR